MYLGQNLGCPCCFFLRPASCVPSVTSLSALSILDCPFFQFFSNDDDSGRFNNMLKPYTPVLEIYDY